MDEAWLHCHQGFELLGASDDERGGDPGIPTEGGNGDQHVIETGLFGGDSYPLEMLKGLRDAFTRIAEGSGVANRWNEPTHLQGFFIIHVRGLLYRVNDRATKTKSVQ
ncbi:hypothetical protein D3C81_1419060 [compost metagenome]